MKEISIQLYSVRDSVKELGFERALDKLGKMGFTGVEFAGFSDVSAKDMKRYLDNAGLKAVSSHTGYDTIVNNLEKEMEYMGYLGAKYITCPGAPMNDLPQVEKTAEEFNKAGRILKENGFTFSYHNHAHEIWLKLKDGINSLDYLFSITDPEYVKTQLDVFHVLRSGTDPYAYCDKYKDRMPTLHLKQMKSVETKEDARAGEGVIDFKKIIEITSAGATKEYIYEDEGIGDQMIMAETSAKYLVQL